MRVVTYARVSTIGQETEGQSLQNQERAFKAWLARNGHELVHAYKEAASAGTVAGRAEFSRMLRDLHLTKPDCIVVDTLDRFTRDLRDGLNLLHEMRGRGVGLLPLDWDRETPLNPDDDRDWDALTDEFKAAERERRRIRRRVRIAFQGRRDRGATFVNKVPFGLKRAGDHMTPDPDTAWIVNEVDRRLLAGEAIRDITKWTMTIHPDAWKTPSGLSRVFRNRNYVVGGLRSEETQKQLDVIMRALSDRHGQQRKHAYELTGVFACGHCLEAGFSEKDVLMSGHGSGYQDHSIQCARWDPENPVKYRHDMCIQEKKVLPFWKAYLAQITAPGWVEKWAAVGTHIDERRLALERQLSGIDQRAAGLKKRRDAAFDLLTDRAATVKNQARKMLHEIEQDEMQLSIERQAVLSELDRVPATERDPALMRSALEAYLALYEAADVATRNRLNRALCEAIGSHPIIRRKEPERQRWSKLEVKWPAVDSYTPAQLRQNA